MMKKIIALCLLCAMLLALCACGNNNSKEPEPTDIPEDIPADVEASNSDAAANAQNHQPPASSTDAAPAMSDNATANEETFAAAKECIGQPVEALYAAVGEPNEEPQYAPSCLQEGAEDGMLYYDGFYVWTVRSETEELVHAVEIWP